MKRAFIFNIRGWEVGSVLIFSGTLYLTPRTTFKDVTKLSKALHIEKEDRAISGQHLYFCIFDTDIK